MHPANRFFYISLGILALVVSNLATPSVAYGQTRVVGVTSRGQIPALYAALSNGDLFQSDGGNWVAAGNLFDSVVGGGSAGETIVGVASDPIDDDFWALSSLGRMCTVRFYQVDPGPTVFERAGRPPGEMVSFDWCARLGRFLAASANGDVYSIMSPRLGAEVEHLGSLTGLPTPTLPSTWGRVKAERR